MDYMGVIGQMVMANIEQIEPDSGTDTHELVYPDWAGHRHNSLNSKDLGGGLKKGEDPPKGGDG